MRSEFRIIIIPFSFWDQKSNTINRSRWDFGAIFWWACDELLVRFCEISSKIVLKFSWDFLTSLIRSQQQLFRNLIYQRNNDHLTFIVRSQNENIFNNIQILERWIQLKCYLKTSFEFCVSQTSQAASNMKGDRDDSILVLI